MHKGSLVSLTAMALVAVWTTSAKAVTFPADTAWVPLTKDGTPLADPLGDGVNERDIVGDATHPAAYVAQDATNLYFRLRVDKDPKKTDGTFEPFGWGCGLDIDANAKTIEFWASVNGIENTGPDGNPDQVEWRWNSTPTPDNVKDNAETLVKAYAATEPTGNARRVTAAGSSFGGDADYFIDWAIPLSILRTPPTTTAGVPPTIAASTPIRFACGSSSNASSMDADPVAGGTGDPLSGLFSDPLVCSDAGCASDRDGDGVPDSVETTLGTDPTKADSDGDGILDNVELSTTGGSGPFSKVDTDGDGTIDALDTDSDNDGILDSVEKTGDDDGDGKPNFRDADSGGGDSGVAPDSGTTGDSGSSADSGATGDAGASGDSGVATTFEGESIEGGGFGCTVPAGSAGSTVAALGIGLAAAALARRRSKRG